CSNWTPSLMDREKGTGGLSASCAVSEALLGRCNGVLLLTSQRQHGWRSYCQFRGDLALDIAEHRHWRARDSKQPPHAHAVLVKQHRGAQPHRLVVGHAIGRDHQQLRCSFRWPGLPGFEVGEHALAEAATGPPEEYQHPAASE